MVKHLIWIALAVTASVATAQTELDQESKFINQMERARELPQTVVIRVNEKTKEVQVAHSQEALPEGQLSPAEIAQQSFKSVDVNKTYAKSEFNELDRDQSQESWYFYVGFNSYPNYCCYYYPRYYYYGYPYAYYPYYSYPYYGWTYYYYRWY